MSSLTPTQLALKSSFEQIIGDGFVLTDSEFHLLYVNIAQGYVGNTLQVVVNTLNSIRETPILLNKIQVLDIFLAVYDPSLTSLSLEQIKLKLLFQEIIGGGDFILTESEFNNIYNSTIEGYPTRPTSQMTNDAINAVGTIREAPDNITITESQGYDIALASIAYFNLINNIPNPSVNIVFDLPLEGSREMQHDITLNGDYDQTYDVVEQWSSNVLHVPVLLSDLSAIFSSVATSGEDVTDVTMDVTALKSAIAVFDSSFFIRELQQLDGPDQLWQDAPQITLHSLLDGAGANESVPQSLINARARNGVREETASVNTATSFAALLDTISNVAAKDYRLHFYNDVSAAGGLSACSTLGFLATYDVSYGFTFTIAEDSKAANPTPSDSRMLYYSTTTNTQYELPSLTESYSNADVKFGIKFHIVA